ncbi:MAG: hypothetical protein ACREJD_15675 [Phycisphaerales bacterium]
MRRFFLSAATALALALPALAQSTAFSYQGRLTTAGVPYTGSATIQVSVFDAAVGGTLLAGPQYFPNVPVVSGIYTITPDFGPIFGGAGRWLEFRVITPAGVGVFQTLSPRQPVNAVPVATSLVGTSPVSGVDISQTVAGNLIGSDPPASLVQTFKPHYSGRLLTVNVLYAVPGLTNIPLSVEDAAGNELARTNTMVSTPGNVYVALTFDSPPALQAGNTYRLILYAGAGVVDAALFYAPNNPYPDGTLQGDPVADATFTTIMDVATQFDQNISFAKKVGIGTTAPASSLHIANTDGITIGKNATAGGFTALALGLTSESGGSATIQAIQNAGSNYGNLILNPALGNVGIGESNPGFRLDVTSFADGNMLRLTSSTPATVLSLTNVAAGGKNYSLLSKNTGALAIRDVGAATDRLTLFSNGRVALGFATAPDSMLEIHGEANGTALSAKAGPGNGAVGLYASGSGPGVKAGLFDGNVTINGNLQVNGVLGKTSGSFKIPHPLDPEHKWLYHSFVESPDMMNVYNGLIVLDDKGEAVVELPDYFQALNSDYRYQLTPVGTSMPTLFISREVEKNSFAIAGGKPGAKVSWQVTGIRQDAAAKKQRIVPEVSRSAGEP